VTCPSKNNEGKPCPNEYPPNAPAGTIRKHLDRCHADWTVEADKEKKASVEGDKESPPKIQKTLVSSLGPKASAEARASKESEDLKVILKDFLSCNTSFRCVEHSPKQEILRKAGLMCPSRRKLARSLIRFADIERKQIHEQVANIDVGILCADLWSSNSNQDFLSVLIFYVDKQFYLCSRLIAFEEIENRHTGENIVQALRQVCNRIGLVPAEQIAAVCTDSLKAVRLWHTVKDRQTICQSVSVTVCF
jgi:hypothetical protein